MKRARILICDDEPGVRDSLRLILGREHDLTFVKDGQEAVDHLRVQAMDLIIMDIKMPRMGGLDALPKIKKLRPKIKVLIATGYESSDVASQAINLGADEYIVKPFERQTVLTTVQALLSSSAV